MKRKILWPTDFSDNAWNALVYALKFHADEVCIFHLLNSTTLKLPTMSSLTNKLLETMMDDAMVELSKLKELAEQSNANANHEFKVILSPENLKDAIKSAVKKHHIDLIVMGTKGATGTKEIFFGSHTVNTIKNMRQCPTLVIPEEFDFEVPKQIAFPTDFNRYYDYKELKALKQLADVFNSKIRILHINDKEKLNEVQEHNLESLKTHLECYDYSFHWMPKYGKKTTEINDFIKELKIDILAIVNYKHSYIEKIIKEPVIKNLGYHPIIPLLVIPG